MPATNTPGDSSLEATLAGLERRLRALETQQTFVITDPTEAEGDPAHGHAVLVIGSLRAITGIAAYGAASYATGKWVRL